MTDNLDGEKLTPEDMARIREEIRAALAAPAVRPICREIDVNPAGTRLVKAFPVIFAREGSYGIGVPAIAISVFTLKFRPANPADLPDLTKHIRMAVEKLADSEPEFQPVVQRYGSGMEYTRPRRQEGYVENAYVYAEDGEVIISQPMILSDVIQVYKNLEGVLIPGKHIAQELERARWNEARGPLKAVDQLGGGRYNEEAVDPLDKLGNLADVNEDSQVDAALQEAAKMRLANVTTTEEMVQHVIVIAAQSAQGLIGNERHVTYPALPGRSAEGKALSVAEMTDRVLDRAQDMLADVMEQIGETGALPEQAFERAAAGMKSGIDAAMQAQRDDYSRQVDDDFERRRANRKPQSLGDMWRKHEKLNLVSDANAGKVYRRDDEREAARKAAEAEGKTFDGTLKDVAMRSGIALAGPEIGFFQPRRHTLELTDNDWDTDEEYVVERHVYQSRPAGTAYAPLTPLPEELEQYLDRAQPGQDTKATVQLLLGGPA